MVNARTENPHSQLMLRHNLSLLWNSRTHQEENRPFPSRNLNWAEVFSNLQDFTSLPITDEDFHDFYTHTLRTLRDHKYLRLSSLRTFGEAFLLAFFKNKALANSWDWIISESLHSGCRPMLFKWFYTLLNFYTYVYLIMGVTGVHSSEFRIQNIKK